MLRHLNGTLVPGNSSSTKTHLVAGYMDLAPSSPLDEYNEERSDSCRCLPADMSFQTFTQVPPPEEAAHQVK